MTPEETAAELSLVRAALIDAVYVFGLQQTAWHAHYRDAINRAWEAELDRTASPPAASQGAP